MNILTEYISIHVDRTTGSKLLGDNIHSPFILSLSLSLPFSHFVLLSIFYLTNELF